MAEPGVTASVTTGAPAHMTAGVATGMATSATAAAGVTPAATPMPASMALLSAGVNGKKKRDPEEKGDGCCCPD